jgi:hypothetical protein
LRVFERDVLGNSLLLERIHDLMDSGAQLLDRRPTIGRGELFAESHDNALAQPRRARAAKGDPSMQVVELSSSLPRSNQIGAGGRLAVRSKNDAVRRLDGKHECHPLKTLFFA